LIRNFLRPTALKRTFFFIIADALIFYFSFFMAYQLRFNFHVPPLHMEIFHHLVVPLIVLKIIVLFALKFYFITWRFFVLKDVLKLLYGLSIAYIIFIVYVKFFQHGPFPRSSIVIDFLLSLVFISAFRFSRRLLGNFTKNSKVYPTLIIGANQKAVQIISACESRELPFYPVAIVDNDKSVLNSYLIDKKVFSCGKLEELVQKYDINSAIITKNYDPDALDALFERLKKAGVENIKLSKLLGNKEEKLRDISIEDLLARRPKDLDTKVIDRLIEDKVVITGAGGSIGSEIVRQCARSGAKRLILLDHSEFNLYQICEEILHSDVVPLMQSVVDKKLLEKSFQTYRPDIVIHAAAYKHVPLCEENVEGAILNNIIGTKNCIDLSIKYEVDKFVLISTDKAVRPTNVMGATKRICELYAQNVESGKTLISGVRFGNVLGSSGSVIPKFKKLIAQNRPLTITHPHAISC